MSYKSARIAAMLAISVILMAAIVTAVINAMAKQPLKEAVQKAGYHSISSTLQNHVGYGVSQYLRAKAGTCSVLIYRRETKGGYWYTTFYGKEQLSSDGSLPNSQKAVATITRLTGTTCAV